MYLMYGTRVLLSFVILPTIISINHVEQTLSFVICNVFLIGPLIIGIIYAVIITIPIEKVEIFSKKEIKLSGKETPLPIGRQFSNNVYNILTGKNIEYH